MAHSASQPELDLFKQLKGIKIVFDVGARTDIDYLLLNPKIELHAFEPNPTFFKELLENVLKTGHQAYLNNHGLSDKEGEFRYSLGVQSFLNGNGEMILPVRTLNWYVQQNKIKKIDLLKIDTEGWDYKVIVGGSEIIPKTKYIQYEHWDDAKAFVKLLKKDFDMEYMGYRNVFCMNKKLVSKKTRDRLIKFIRDNKFGDLA